MPKMQHDGRLVKENGKYYIVVISSSLQQFNPENQRIEREQNPRVVSIDPGSRTFLTCYDPQGKMIEIGKDCVSHLSDLYAKEIELLR